MATGVRLQQIGADDWVVSVTPLVEPADLPDSELSAEDTGNAAPSAGGAKDKALPDDDANSGGIIEGGDEE